MNINLKIFLPVVLAILVLASLMHFLWLPDMLESRRQSIIDEEHRLLWAVDAGLTHSIMSGSREVIYGTLDHLMDKQQILEHGKSHSKEYTEAHRWQQVILRDVDGKRLYPLNATPDISGPYILDIKHAIFRDEKKIGEILLKIDWQEDFLIQRKHIITMELWALLIFAFTILAAGVWQNRWIRFPILRLAQASDSMVQGDCEAQLPKAGNDDIGRLTIAFGNMREQVTRARGELQKSMGSITESESRYRNLFDTMIDGLIIINEKGLIDSFNSAAEKIFGYQTNEVLDKNVGILMDEFIASQHDGYLARYINDNDSDAIGIGREIYGRRKDGSRFPVDIALSDIVINGHRYFSAVVRDISNRVHAQELLRESTEQLNNILENTDDAYMVIDHEWRVNYANTMCKSLLAVEPGRVVGVDLREELPDLVSMFYEILRKTLVDRQGQEDVMLFPPTMKYLAVYTHPVQKGLIVHFHDVTKQKQSEDALRQAKQEAEKADHAKSEFLSRMSHELRTPMNAIIGYGQLLVMDGNDMSLEEQQEQMQHILTAADHLMKLINKVLDITRAEAGEMELILTPVSLDKMFSELSRLIQPLIGDNNISLELPTAAPRVMADELRLRQVLVNLLLNAAMYNNKGGIIKITALDQDNGYARICIIDNGRGILEQDQADIFDPFRRGSDWSADIEGAGIGLSISKQLIELMGGHIGFNSEYGKGSTFWIDLPVAE